MVCHQRHGQRDDGEVGAAHAAEDEEVAEEERDGHGEEDRPGHAGERGVAAAHHRCEHRRAVGAEAEEGGVTEA